MFNHELTDRIIFLENQLKTLKDENTALKTKMTLLYENWAFDSTKYNNLKEEYKKIKLNMKII